MSDTAKPAVCAPRPSLVRTAFDLARKWFPSAESRQLRLKETLPLGERRSLAVVEWQGEQLLIGLGGGTVSLLTKRPGVPRPGVAGAE